MDSVTIGPRSIHQASGALPKRTTTTLDAPFPSRLALVGSYPPTHCGIATFTSSLHRSIAARTLGNPPDVFRVLQRRPGGDAAPEVVWELEPDDPQSVAAAARRLSAYGSVILQHEFGIFGSGYGRSVVELVNQVTVPLIVTLHTVTKHPLEAHRVIVSELGSRADRLVVMSDVAREFLDQSYGIAPEKVDVIPHGGDGPRRRRLLTTSEVDERLAPILLNWGLIGPGKGLEWAILATGLLRDRYPDIRLVIAGRTHPKAREEEGEAYRDSLREMVDRAGLQSHVVFINEYLARETIHDLISDATLVVLPYDSTEQTSSGVLVEAIAAGVPVVATDFPQAVEMAERGAAVVVPHQNAERLAEAAAALIDDPEHARRMVGAQADFAGAAAWSEVGLRYLHLAKELSPSIAM